MKRLAVVVLIVVVALMATLSVQAAAWFPGPAQRFDPPTPTRMYNP